MELVDTVPARQEEPEAADVDLDILLSEDAAQIEASAELILDLRAMVNNPAHSDVVFVCKDGERVHASRVLLVVRSAVLKSMLTNGMAETSCTELHLPETSSPALLSVFEFLHTGTLLDYRPQNWSRACEVFVASQFFLLPNLERITRKLMHSQTSIVAADLSKVALMLTEALEFKAMWTETDVNLRKLVYILSSDWSDPDFVQSLSENALHYLLANSGGYFECDSKFVFEEYLRFRLVVLWYVYTSPNGPSSVEEFVNSVVPDEERALSFCIDFNSRDKSFYDDAALPSSTWESFLQDRGIESRQSILKLTSHVDCRRIHPILLAQVVEPMKIISAEQIMSSLWFHTLRRPMIFKRLEIGWKHGESYSVAEQPYTIERTGNEIGLAVATVAMSRPYGAYKWHFILEDMCTTFVEFGLILFADGIPDVKGNLDGAKLSELDHAGILWSAVACSDSKASWRAGKRLDWDTLGSRLNEATLCSYDASERTCSFSHQGRDSGVIWADLPRGTYYPVVCLGDSSNGRVRIELVSGFDLL